MSASGRRRFVTSMSHVAACSGAGRSRGVLRGTRASTCCVVCSGGGLVGRSSSNGGLQEPVQPMLGSPCSSASRLLLPAGRVAKRAILKRRCLIRKGPVRKAFACSSSTGTGRGTLLRRAAVGKCSVLETCRACTLPFFSCRVGERAIGKTRVALLLLRLLLLLRRGWLLLLAAGASCVVGDGMRESEDVRGLKGGNEASTNSP